MTDPYTALRQCVEALESLDGAIAALLGSLLLEPEPDSPGAKVRAAIADARAALDAQPEPTAPFFWRCPTHGRAPANAWGCPSCVVDLRGDVDRLREALRHAAEEPNIDKARAIADRELYGDAPPQRQPLTSQQLDKLIEAHVGGAKIEDGEYSAMVMFAAAVERAHGIG